MTTEQDLFSLERKFWTGNADFYRANLDDQCLVAFTEMAGVMGNSAIADMIKEGQRWSNLEITEKGFLPVSDNVAILTYETSAKRANGEPYHAVVSSGYVKRNGQWKMAFHQQTPLTSEI